MIKSVSIENFKSIQKLQIDLGRITVLIGANGSGKSTILEAIALASAAENYKLDNEFLASRGIRVTDDPRFMRSAFDKKNVSKGIQITIEGGKGTKFEYFLQKDNKRPYSAWKDKGVALLSVVEDIRKRYLDKNISSKDLPEESKEKIAYEVARSIVRNSRESINIDDFLIYSPENTALRTFEIEGQIEPLGIKGEGLFKLVKVLHEENNAKRLDEIKSKLKLIDWFNDFGISTKTTSNDRRIRIKDKYLDNELAYFDQRSSNEGFLFLLFYLCLFVSDDTPNFFAIDNIDASLNPKLCTQLIIELNKLAKKHKKQAIFTTHNPAILDGLDLNDENQKLVVVYRNKLGETKIEQASKPKPIEGQDPLKLSEAFLRGLLGGLPQNF